MGPSLFCSSSSLVSPFTSASAASRRSSSMKLIRMTAWWQPAAQPVSDMGRHRGGGSWQGRGRSLAHLPVGALALKVDVKVGWVEVQDGAALVGEEPVVGLGQVLAAGGGQHRQQLLEGQEGLAQRKLDVHRLDVHRVGGARRVVERVVPARWRIAGMGAQAPCMQSHSRAQGDNV